MIRLQPIIAVQTYIFDADYKREDAAVVLIAAAHSLPPRLCSVPPTATAELHNRQTYFFSF